MPQRLAGIPLHTGVPPGLSKITRPQAFPGVPHGCLMGFFTAKLAGSFSGSPLPHSQPQPSLNNPPASRGSSSIIMWNQPFTMGFALLPIQIPSFSGGRDAHGFRYCPSKMPFMVDQKCCPRTGQQTSWLHHWLCKLCAQYLCIYISYIFIHTCTNIYSHI